MVLNIGLRSYLLSRFINFNARTTLFLLSFASDWSQLHFWNFIKFLWNCERMNKILYLHLHRHGRQPFASAAVTTCMATTAPVVTLTWRETLLIFISHWLCINHYKLNVAIILKFTGDFKIYLFFIFDHRYPSSSSYTPF
jgi:hypothetical protein